MTSVFHEFQANLDRISLHLDWCDTGNVLEVPAAAGTSRPLRIADNTVTLVSGRGKILPVHPLTIRIGMILNVTWLLFVLMN